jgi:hypothetical protein
MRRRATTSSARQYRAIQQESTGEERGGPAKPGPPTRSHIPSCPALMEGDKQAIQAQIVPCFSRASPKHSNAVRPNQGRGQTAK